MPIVTAIKPQRSRKRVNIYVDGVFGFGLDLESFVKIGLKVGQEFTSEELNKLVVKAEYQKTLNKLLNYATLRPRSKKEIFDWFYRKKVGDALHSVLINRLEELKLIDDSKFAKWWVDQRVQFKNKSVRELEYELRAKGIDRHVIKDVLQESDINERKSVMELLSKRSYKWENLENSVAIRKKTEYLTRKGFSWQLIKDVLK